MKGTVLTITEQFATTAPVGTELTHTAFENWTRRDDGWAKVNTSTLGPPADEVLDPDQFKWRFEGADMSVVTFPGTTSEQWAALGEAERLNDAISRIWSAQSADDDDLTQLRAELEVLTARLVRMTQVACAEMDNAPNKAFRRQVGDFSWRCHASISKEIEVVREKINHLTSPERCC